MRLTWKEEELVLCADRALYWPRERTLFVADVHLGKDARMRAAGVSVPEGTTTRDLERLDKLLETTGAQRLVLLGDAVHGRGALEQSLVKAVHEFRERHRGVTIVAVRGNQDRKAERLTELGWVVSEEPAELGPFALHHTPPRRNGRPALCGHVRPAIALADHGADGFRTRHLPCFVFGSQRAILPSFGGFTEVYPYEPRRDERVCAVTSQGVVEVAS